MRSAALLVLVLVAFAAGTGRAAPDPKPFQVGLVVEPGPGKDPFSYAAIVGLRRAMRELGVEGKVLRPTPREGYLPSVLSLARARYDLILGLAVPTAEAMYRAALRFPAVRFAVIDWAVENFPTRPRNLETVSFAAEEAGYLAGYLAALVEARRPGRDVVSSVGGSKLPPIDQLIAGYQAGARKADPRIVLLNGYAKVMPYSAYYKARCRAVALDQIAKGSGVVFQVAGACGLGALAAAKERGVYGIGVDVDQSSLGPHILTSAVKRFDAAVFQTIRSAQTGRFRGGKTTVLGLHAGAVGLGRISPRVPRRLVTQVERIRRQIVSGEIRNIPTTIR